MDANLLSSQLWGLGITSKKAAMQSTIYYYNPRCFPENSFQIPGKTNTSM